MNVTVKLGLSDEGKAVCCTNMALEDTLKAFLQRKAELDKIDQVEGDANGEYCRQFLVSTKLHIPVDNVYLIS